MDLEAGLARLSQQVADPRAGLFGPDSKLWEVNRHSLIFLGAGRAALLQLAHPWVAQAIHDHSRTREDPLGRFRRTFLRVFAMVYGDLDSALHAARRVHALHETITGTLDVDAGASGRGSPYRANDPDALLWVHATLWDSSVRVFERVVRPLSAQEKDAYYADTRRFAALFGIPDERLPVDWDAFAAYNRRMHEGDVLFVTPQAASLGAFLFQPQWPGLGPLMQRYRWLVAALLPDRLREPFGLAFPSARVEVRAERTLDRLRRTQRYLPRRLRYLPPYLAAQRRLAGRTGPDPIGALLERAFVGRR